MTPAPAEDQFRTDLPWADIVSDGRRIGDIRHDPLPRQLPAPGVHTEDYTHGGTVTFPYPDENVSRVGYATVSAHSVPEGRWGYMVTRIVYPDGFVAAMVTGDLGNHTASVGAIWESYVNTAPADAFRRAFLPTDLLRHVTADDITTGLRRSAAAFRDAVLDRDWFFAPHWAPPDEKGPDTTAASLNDCTALGCKTAAIAHEMWDAGVMGEDILGAFDAGFDLDDPEDRAWVAGAGPGDWAQAHGGWWNDLHALKVEGWTVGALKHLHPYGTVRALAQRLAKRDDLPADDGLWRTTMKVDRWLTLAGGSPVVASACLEAGMGFAEAERLVASGTVLDLDMLRTLAGLRSPTT